MSTPPGILLARALHFLEMASLQLTSGATTDAAQSIDRAVELLERMEN